MVDVEDEDNGSRYRVGDTFNCTVRIVSEDEQGFQLRVPELGILDTLGGLIEGVYEEGELDVAFNPTHRALEVQKEIAHLQTRIEELSAYEG